MLDFDLTELLTRKLAESNRAPDGLLHSSSDLIGPLRHSQLRAVGAPMIENELLSAVRLETGTMWHSAFERIFSGKPVMTEVNLTKWMPEGWGGTADWLIWNDILKGFVLSDLKTIKPEAVAYLDGPKPEHHWQISSYWHAVKAMGLPLVKGYVIYYLPMNPLIKEPALAPILMEGTPLEEDVIMPVMEKRAHRVATYKRSFAKRIGQTLFPNGEIPYSWYENAELAPEQEREQVIRWNKAMNVWDVKLQPHWTAMYCPFPTELCRCRLQKTEKIGHFDTFYDPEEPTVVLGPRYFARKGYEDVELTVALTKQQERKLLASS